MTNVRSRAKIVALWLIVALLGSLPLGFGLHRLLAPSMRALRLDSRPSYLLLLLGLALIGVSVIGIVQRWGPLVPGFVIGFLGGLFILTPMSNMPEGMLIILLFFIAGFVAIVLDDAWNLGN